MRARLIVLSALIVLLALIWAYPNPPDGLERISATSPGKSGMSVLWDYPEALLNQAKWERGVAEREWAEGEWRAGEERAAAEEKAREAARRAVPQRQQAATSNGVGECTGFAIPDYIIQRESGGNPFIWNSSGSGAFGCAQTLITHYTGGSCRGLDPYTIEGQRACVGILSNGGTNLAPWAATR